MLACHLLQDLRVDFQFDRAAFTFRALPFKIPYPVPFKLFGDETKARTLHPAPAACWEAWCCSTELSLQLDWWPL